MNSMDRKINELISILEKQEWNAIELELDSNVNIKMTLHKPKYKFIKKSKIIQLHDNITNKKVAITMCTALSIKINEEFSQYEIKLDGEQYIKLKII